MGTVINFPEGRSVTRDDASMAKESLSATVIILPVIRIERFGGEPSDGIHTGVATAHGRRRRRPESRS
jgi:hypothetical protein